MVAQPTGTVTLLFTDIEGSTRLLIELGRDRYTEALDLHRRLLRAAFEAHGGYEVDYEGDAFFVAFSRAEAAVAAAIEAQQALDGADWPDGRAFRVRMGIHTGEPLPAPPKYVGIDVHRAARIMAAAHGGQVLVSRTTRELLDPAVLLRDLGEHRLKDLTDPERLFQLGEDKFPPLRSLNNTNLPRPVSSFVGRRREVDEVTALLRDGARLVTLTGPGGTGKTRLAVEVAAGLLSELDAGIFWVGLGSLQDPSLVIETVVQTLGAQEELAAHIGGRKMLLLLDNFEQLLAAAPDLSELLSACPNLRLLVTSRELLRIQGEAEFAVPQLARDEAVELFCTRAEVRPDEHVVEIARRLDGLPLALELAAARSKVLTTAQIEERLGRSLDLLTTGTRDAPDRQRSLEATIAWSFNLLSEPERRAFTSLGIFASSFDLEAAEAICDADLDTIASLVDKSLLRSTGDGRFVLLETIREFALSHLSATGRLEELRERHSSHYTERVHAGAPVMPTRFDRDFLLDLMSIETEVRSTLVRLREADRDAELQELISRAWLSWYYLGRVAETRRWLEEACSRPFTDQRTRGIVLCGLVTLVQAEGEYDYAVELAQAAVCVFRDLDDLRCLVPALWALAAAHSYSGDQVRADAAIQEAEKVARAIGDEHLLLAILANRTHLAGRTGDDERVLELAAEGIALAEARGDTTILDVLLGNRAESLLQLGRPAEAEMDWRRCLALTHAENSPQRALGSVVGLAATAAARGAFQRAARLLGAASSIVVEFGLVYEEDERRIHDGAIETVERALGRRSFEQTFQAGRSLSLSEIVSEALALEPGDRRRAGR